MDFTCQGCGKSLMSENRIYLGNFNKQYCHQCWIRVKKGKPLIAESKFTAGLKVKRDSVQGCGSTAIREMGVVVRTSTHKVLVDFEGVTKWISPESLTPIEG